MLQSHSIGCYITNSNTEDPIVMQIHLKPKELSKKLLTESRQRNPKPVCKYSPGHQKNVATMLSRALSQH